MSNMLLATKMFIPTSPMDSLVERSLLHHRLNDGSEGKLTLVSAPAGFGKSTLVASWLAGRQDRTAWLSLDEDDNDPGLFWQYVLAALQTIEPDFGLDAKQIIGSPQLHDPRPVLVSMLNEITAESFNVTLVLDDYHLIEAPEIHDSLGFFLEHLPPTAHVLILTRVDPPFSLGRLRACGDLTEIRAADLQFSLDETADFLGRVMNLTLTPEQIAILARRTEGWAVGLKLAALSLQHQSDRAGFIDTFSGSHQYILEYLTEEVLNTLSDARRAFLLRTSILDSFCSPLCEAVTSAPDSSQIIADLLTDNLFIIPLDRRGEWFRYHHLFTQLLQALLHRDFPAEIPNLHLHAARWYDEAGHLAQAAEHTFRSGDMQRARAYVVDHWNDMLHLGGVGTVLKWVKRLPDDMAREDVNLALANCWARYLTGQSPAMTSYISYAESDFHRLVDEGLLAGKQRGLIEAQVYMMRSAFALSQGRFADGVADAEHAVRVVPPEMGIAAGPAWNLLGAARASIGDIDGGIGAYQTGIDIAYHARNFLSAFAAVFWSTIYLIRQGRLTEAHDQCQQALNRAIDDGLSNLPALGLLYVALALIALERNQLEEARKLVEKGGGFSEALRYGRTISARLYLALGETKMAQSVIQDVERIVLATGNPHAIAEMHAEWAKIQIRLGNPDQVRARLDALCQVDAANLAHPLLRFSLDWLSACTLWFDGNTKPALEIVEAALDRAHELNSDGELLRFLILHALILDAADRPAKSRAVLIEALEIGNGQQYIRTWLDAGEQIVPLLDAARRAAADSSGLLAYLDTLIDVCEATFGSASAPNAILTDRELEIVRLIEQGYSNPEIADALVVSLNTVKKHTSNIYSKLGVASRTQAIAKARELNLT
jgi:LuxR family maltose regulon positive regulatory protein